MLVFFLLSFVMIVGALGVILLRQPVHAALSLVGTLLTLAVMYVTLHAHFLAAIQVIVYAGAIMVLFLFVIMLLNIQGDTRVQRFPWLRPVAFLAGAVVAGSVSLAVLGAPRPIPDLAVVTAALQGGGPGPIGDALFTEFILAFQLVAVLLLTGTIAAVALVHRRMVVGRPQGAAAPSQPVEERPKELTNA